MAPSVGLAVAVAVVVVRGEGGAEPAGAADRAAARLARLRAEARRPGRPRLPTLFDCFSSCDANICSSILTGTRPMSC